MAYSEVSVSSPDDVISKIATFATANGWTVDRNTLSGSNRTLTIRKGGSDYIHIYNTDATNVRVRASVGYSAADAPSAQPNVSAEKKITLGSGPYTKLFLMGNDSPAPHIHAIIEMTGGVYRMISVGLLDKLGAWTGGTYVDGTEWSTSASLRYYWNNSTNSALFDCRNIATSWGSVRCDIPLDGRANAWAELKYNAAYRAVTGLFGGLENSVNDSSATGNIGNGYLTTQFYNRNNPPFSGQPSLGNIVVDVYRVGGMFSTIGSYPNVRYLNIGRYSPGQEITVGSETWKVFPMARKAVGTSAANADASNDHGYAFLKTA